MQRTQISLADLAQFSGSENWYRHSLVPSIMFTDGAKYVADAGGAYWLLDKIALAQRYIKAVADQPFQLWKLKVADSKAVLTCEDGNCNVILTEQIAFTDFPLPEIRFYVTDNVILLPSEY